MRVAEETVHDVTARLRNTQTRVAELSTALGAAKRANHTLTEKNARASEKTHATNSLCSLAVRTCCSTCGQQRMRCCLVSAGFVVWLPEYNPTMMATLPAVCV